MCHLLPAEREIAADGEAKPRQGEGLSVSMVLDWRQAQLGQLSKLLLGRGEFHASSCRVSSSLALLLNDIAAVAWSLARAVSSSHLLPGLAVECKSHSQCTMSVTC